MKKTLFAFAAFVLTFSFTSCQKGSTAPEEAEVKYKDLVVSANIEDPVKVTLENRTSIRWAEGDNFKIYYQVNGETKSSTATFSKYEQGQAKFTFKYEDGADLSKLYAVFSSYSDGNPFKIKSGTITTCRYEIPDNQIAVTNGIDGKSATMAAYWQGEGEPVFNFQNICGLISFDLVNNSSKTINEVKFISKSKFPCRSYFGFDSEGKLSVSESKAIDEVVLSGDFSTSGQYTIACGVATLKDPIFSFIATDGSYFEFGNPNALVVERNSNKYIGKFTLTDDLFEPYANLSKSGTIVVPALTTFLEFYVSGNCSWNIGVNGEGANLSQNSGKGLQKITLSLPYNNDTDNSKSFTVTLNPDPTKSLPEKTFTIEQAQLDTIQFGCKMSSNFLSSLQNAIKEQGSDRNKVYSVENFYVKQIGDKTIGIAKTVMTEQLSISFVSGSRGNGILKLYGGRVYKGKICSLKVERNGVDISDETINNEDVKILDATGGSTKSLKDVSIRISSVQEGDVITISTGTSSGNNQIGLLEWLADNS